MKEEYLLVTIHASPADRDAFADILWTEGSLGFQESEAEGRLEISSWFLPGRNEVENRIREHAENRSIRYYECISERRSYDPDEWVARFSHSFPGVELDDRFFVHPPWIEPSPRFPVNIMIEPGHAFGTGTHESTQLALLAMAPISGTAESFLDVGTGSGILAAAAGIMSPNLDLAVCDIDDMALESAVETLHKNGISRFRAVTGGPEEFRGTSFQVVAANLTSPVIRKLAPELVGLTGEFLVLSGFTEDQYEITLEAFLNQEFREDSVYTRNGWMSSRLRRIL